MTNAAVALAPAPANDAADPIELHLHVDEPQLIAILQRRSEPGEQQRFALDSLRVGLFALDHAHGRFDADRLQREAHHLIGTLNESLAAHVGTVNERVSDTLKAHFDPKSGLFEQRLHGLLKPDGELQRALSNAVGADGSVLARTLAAHVGAGSPLLRSLDPKSADGVLSAIRDSIAGTLDQYQQAMHQEMSLDNDQGALRRLVSELEARHGRLEASMSNRIADVVAEFSLDDDESALSRLVVRVEQAQKTIADQLTLDNDRSALARMAHKLDATNGTIRGQLSLDDPESPMARMMQRLTELIDSQSRDQAAFREQVACSFAEISARRGAEARSPEHGRVFEDLVVAEMLTRAQRLGDLGEATGATVGRVRHCKKGDAVVELGAESVASGAKIVIEAKEDRTFTVKRALEELHSARDNREASVGVFVFSKKTAPPGSAGLTRVGQDVLLVWDADDPANDVILDAGLQVARALSIRASRSQEESEVMATLEPALRAIEKRVNDFLEIQKWASTIEGNAKKIGAACEKGAVELRDQVRVLEGLVESLSAAKGAAE